MRRFAVVIHGAPPSRVEIERKSYDEVRRVVADGSLTMHVCAERLYSAGRNDSLRFPHVQGTGGDSLRRFAGGSEAAIRTLLGAPEGPLTPKQLAEMGANGENCI